jgi:hypothetical protein
MALAWDLDLGLCFLGEVSVVESARFLVVSGVLLWVDRQSFHILRMFNNILDILQWRQDENIVLPLG